MESDHEAGLAFSFPRVWEARFLQTFCFQVQAQIERKEGMQPLDRSVDCISRFVKESGGEKVTILQPTR
jgi:hypothetical protein